MFERKLSPNKPTQIKINIKSRLAGKLWRSKSFITFIIVIWNDNLPFTPHYHTAPLSISIPYHLHSAVLLPPITFALIQIIYCYLHFWLDGNCISLTLYLYYAITIKLNLISFRIASYEVNVSQDINRILW